MTILKKNLRKKSQKRAKWLLESRIQYKTCRGFGTTFAKKKDYSVNDDIQHLTEKTQQHEKLKKAKILFSNLKIMVMAGFTMMSWGFGNSLFRGEVTNRVTFIQGRQITQSAQQPPTRKSAPLENIKESLAGNSRVARNRRALEAARLKSPVSSDFRSQIWGKSFGDVKTVKLQIANVSLHQNPVLDFKNRLLQNVKAFFVKSSIFSNSHIKEIFIDDAELILYQAQGHLKFFTIEGDENTIYYISMPYEEYRINSALNDRIEKKVQNFTNDFIKQKDPLLKVQNIYTKLKKNLPGYKFPSLQSDHVFLKDMDSAFGRISRDLSISVFVPWNAKRTNEVTLFMERGNLDLRPTENRLSCTMRDKAHTYIDQSINDWSTIVRVDISKKGVVVDTETSSLLDFFFEVARHNYHAACEQHLINNVDPFFERWNMTSSSPGSYVMFEAQSFLEGMPAQRLKFYTFCTNVKKIGNQSPTQDGALIIFAHHAVNCWELGQYYIHHLPNLDFRKQFTYNFLAAHNKNYTEPLEESVFVAQNHPKAGFTVDIASETQRLYVNKKAALQATGTTYTRYCDLIDNSVPAGKYLIGKPGYNGNGAFYTKTAAQKLVNPLFEPPLDWTSSSITFELDDVLVPENKVNKEKFLTKPAKPNRFITRALDGLNYTRALREGIIDMRMIHAAATDLHHFFFGPRSASLAQVMNAANQAAATSAQNANVSAQNAQNASVSAQNAENAENASAQNATNARNAEEVSAANALSAKESAFRAKNAASKAEKAALDVDRAAQFFDGGGSSLSSDTKQRLAGLDYPAVPRAQAKTDGSTEKSSEATSMPNPEQLSTSTRPSPTSSTYNPSNIPGAPPTLTPQNSGDLDTTTTAGQESANNE